MLSWLKSWVTAELLIPYVIPVHTWLVYPGNKLPMPKHIREGFMSDDLKFLCDAGCDDIEMGGSRAEKAADAVW